MVVVLVATHLPTLCCLFVLVSKIPEELQGPALVLPLNVHTKDDTEYVLRLLGCEGLLHILLKIFGTCSIIRMLI